MRESRIQLSLTRSARVRAGFTLIEILIVVFILSILAALVIPLIVSSMSDSKLEAAKARGTQICTMVVRYNRFHPATSITVADGPIAQTELNKLVEASYCTPLDLTNLADSTKGWSFAGNSVVPTP